MGGATTLAVGATEALGATEAVGVDDIAGADDCAVGIAGGGASSAFPPQAFATTPAEASKPKANTFTKRRMF